MKMGMINPSRARVLKMPSQTESMPNFRGRTGWMSGLVMGGVDDEVNRGVKVGLKYNLK